MGHIFLTGFMGAGKSRTAALLEKEYGFPYVEMDREIERAEGISIPEIFSSRGEEYFRRKETEMIRSFRDREDMVVSCGGGVVLRQENVDEMRSQGTIVWLTAKPETIYERVKGSHHRPLLEGNMNVEYIRKLLAGREPRYRESADVRVRTDHRSPKKICEEILISTGHGERQRG